MSAPSFPEKNIFDQKISSLAFFDGEFPAFELRKLYFLNYLIYENSDDHTLEELFTEKKKILKK